MKIVSLKKEHIATLLKLSNKRFGESYLSRQAFDLCLENSSPFICDVAIINNKPVGFCLCETLYNVYPFNSLMNITKKHSIPQFKNCSKIGYIKCVIVNQDYEHQGIATKLIKKSLKRFKKMKIHAFISTAWKWKGTIFLKTPFLANGFEPYIELKKYWNDCDNCIYSHLHYCYCSCVIYIKRS